MAFLKTMRFWILVVSVLLFASNLYAAPPFTVQPKIAGSFKTDSNFFKSETDEREVHAYVLEPGIILGFQTAKSDIMLDYTASLNYYDDQDPVPAGQAAADAGDYVGHLLNLLATTRPLDRVSLSLEESFLRTNDPGQSDRFANAVGRDEYFVNRISPQVYYEFEGKFAARLKYRNTLTDYDPADREDSSEHRGIFDLIYNLNRTTAFDLEYQYWQTSYDLTTSDYSSQQAMLIWRAGFRIFSFELGGGYHWRNFDGTNLQDQDLATYRLAVTAQQARSNLSLFYEHNFNDLGQGDSYYTSDRVTLAAGHTFLDKIPVLIKGYYQASDYETFSGTTPAGTTELREDEIYNISGSVGYMITDWLTFLIEVGTENRDSNLDGYDYDNVWFMVQVKSLFDLGSKKSSRP